MGEAASYKKEGDALGFHRRLGSWGFLPFKILCENFESHVTPRSKKHKVAYGEALSEAPAFVPGIF